MQTSPTQTNSTADELQEEEVKITPVPFTLETAYQSVPALKTKLS